MIYSLPLILTIAVTFLGAGFVKGVTGMGLPTVAMGILGALISPLSAASLLIIPSFITNLWQLLAGPSFGQLMLRLWSMMLAIAVGTIAGTAVLVGEHCSHHIDAGLRSLSMQPTRCSPASYRCRKSLNACCHLSSGC